MQNNNKIFIILIVSIISFLFFTIFFIIPLYNDIQKISYDFSLLKNKNLYNDTQLKEINSFKNNFNLYEQDLKKMKEMLVDQSNPVNFIKFLEDTSNSNGLLTKISLKQQSLQADDIARFHLTTTGPYNKVISFIKNLEFGHYLIQIEELTLQNQKNITNEESPEYTEGENESRIINANILIKVILQK